jgi:hypothetical protein
MKHNQKSNHQKANGRKRKNPKQAPPLFHWGGVVLSICRLLPCFCDKPKDPFSFSCQNLKTGSLMQQNNQPTKQSANKTIKPTKQSTNKTINQQNNKYIESEWQQSDSSLHSS